MSRAESEQHKIFLSLGEKKRVTCIITIGNPEKLARRSCRIAKATPGDKEAQQAAKSDFHFTYMYLDIDRANYSRTILA